MPNIKSAMKRLRSDAKREDANRRVLSELKTLDKKLQAAAKEPKTAQEIAARYTSRLDSAVSKGVIPRGRADRKKSNIASFVKKLAA